MSPRLTALRVTSLAALTAVIAVPRAAAAQVSTFEACTTSALQNCAVIRLTTQAVVGGTNLEIALQALGSQTSPSLATDVYFLTMFTGQVSAPEIDPSSVPQSEGGVLITDASPWSIAESGDVIFLNSPGSNGVGNCVFAPPAGGFGQIGRTCAGQFITFSFFTPRAFDATTFTLGDVEFAMGPDGSVGDSCNDPTNCTITPLAPVSATPEPASIVLTLTGLTGLVAIRRRRSGEGR